MAQFRMKIAGQTGAVAANFPSTIEYFRAYLTDEAADFSVTVSREEMDREQALSIAEALEEGIRPRQYTDPHLERAVIQRKFAEWLMERNALLFHGSAVAVDGRAYLFTAGCGVGKSTHTRLWRQVFGDRAVMINDDKPFLRVEETGVLVCGSPWAGKHGLHSNVSLPLRGICILERGAENRIRRIGAGEALDMLRRQSYHPPDPRKEAVILSLVDRLAETVPLWRMACTKDPEAARLSHRAMSQS